MGDKSAAYKASKAISFIQILIGGFFTVMYGLMLFIFIIDALFIRETEPLEAYDYFILLILLALSAFLMSRGVRRKKLLKLTKDYMIRLNSDLYKSTITLANSLGVPENLVIDNLNKMLLSRRRVKLCRTPCQLSRTATSKSKPKSGKAGLHTCFCRPNSRPSNSCCKTSSCNL